jgi:hypothetical protein
MSTKYFGPSLRHTLNEISKLISKTTGFSLYREVDFSEFAASPTQISEHERNRTDIHKIFYSNTGSPVTKWHHYLGVYDRHLSRYRNKPVRILEIGVWQGGSLRMWRKYFGASAIIYGIDIDPECARFNGSDGQVRIGSQTDANFLRNVVDEMGGVDVVIDDGSHISQHQRLSFSVLFPLLSSTGIYICEDTQTSYLGYRFKTSFVDFAKKIIDDLYADFHGQPLTVQDANRSIEGIFFYNGIVLVEKAPQSKATFSVV